MSKAAIVAKADDASDGIVVLAGSEVEWSGVDTGAEKYGAVLIPNVDDGIAVAFEHRRLELESE